jgi:hypothetical protein
MARTHHLLTILLLSSSPAGACPPAAHAPPDDAHAPRALIDLRWGLMNAGRDKAQADVARFRPLCDQDGYPLVGNLVEKRTMYQPSEFCREVRQHEKRS